MQDIWSTYGISVFHQLAFHLNYGFRLAYTLPFRVAS